MVQEISRNDISPVDPRAIPVPQGHYDVLLKLALSGDVGGIYTSSGWFDDFQHEHTSFAAKEPDGRWFIGELVWNGEDKAYSQYAIELTPQYTEGRVSSYVAQTLDLHLGGARRTDTNLYNQLSSQIDEPALQAAADVLGLPVEHQVFDFVGREETLIDRGYAPKRKTIYRNNFPVLGSPYFAKTFRPEGK